MKTKKVCFEIPEPMFGKFLEKVHAALPCYGRILDDSFVDDLDEDERAEDCDDSPDSEKAPAPRRKR